MLILVLLWHCPVVPLPYRILLQTATTYNFEAVYQGDSNYVSGTTGAASGTLTVNKGTATVNAPTLNPSVSITFGTSVT